MLQAYIARAYVAEGYNHGQWPCNIQELCPLDPPKILTGCALWAPCLSGELDPWTLTFLKGLRLLAPEYRGLRAVNPLHFRRGPESGANMSCA